MNLHKFLKKNVSSHLLNLFIFLVVVMFLSCLTGTTKSETFYLITPNQAVRQLLYIHILSVKFDFCKTVLNTQEQSDVYIVGVLVQFRIQFICLFPPTINIYIYIYIYILRGKKDATTFSCFVNCFTLQGNPN